MVYVVYSCCKLQVFDLDVACFTHMLQVYVTNVSFASKVCCIQVFHVASVSCFRGMFRESWGHGPGAGGRGAASRGSTDGACGASGHARPHPGSWVPLVRREGGGSGERSGGRWAGRDRRGAGYACVVGRGRRRRTATIQWECGTFLLDRLVPFDGILSH